MRAKFIGEAFSDETDPIQDMGIGDKREIAKKELLSKPLLYFDIKLNDFKVDYILTKAKKNQKL